MSADMASWIAGPIAERCPHAVRCEDREHDHDEDDEPEVPRRLSWREATYKFAPLRNALIAGLLLALGIVMELPDAPEGLAIAAFIAAIPIGAWFFAQEGWRSSSTSARSASRR